MVKPTHATLEDVITSSHGAHPPAVYAGPEALPARPAGAGVLALVGDTQRTSLLELLWRHHDPEQRALFADLARRRLDGLVNLGDLVTWGGSRRAWRHFDRLHGALRAAAVPVMPVMGNHDYLPTRGGARRHLARRFPWLQGRRWYTFRWRGLAFVALDSNFRALGARAAAAQDRWLGETAAALAVDPDVRGVVGLWHHPPFTNSRVVRPSAAARDRLAAPLMASGKALAVFSGHCHAYERFEHEGVAFVVSGGGGGPLQRVEHRPQRRRFADRFAWPWPLRFLNYCALHAAEDGAVELVVTRVVDEALPLAVVDRVALTRHRSAETTRP